jgi:hypothetical protein
MKDWRAKTGLARLRVRYQEEERCLDREHQGKSGDIQYQYDDALLQHHGENYRELVCPTTPEFQAC